MGVNQSKGSVDITSTPNKGPAPEVNGKKADEKIIDEKTKVRNYDRIKTISDSMQLFCVTLES